MENVVDLLNITKTKTKWKFIFRLILFALNFYQMHFTVYNLIAFRAFIQVCLCVFTCPLYRSWLRAYPMSVDCVETVFRNLWNHILIGDSLKLTLNHITFGPLNFVHTKSQITLYMWFAYFDARCDSGFVFGILRGFIIEIRSINWR